MKINNKYKFFIVVGVIYTLMFVNFNLTLLLLTMLFQILISVSTYKRFKGIIKFGKDICVRGNVLELREIKGELTRYFKYEFIVEFEWENKKFITNYKFNTLFKPKYENKIVDVWIDESNPENSVVTESAGSKNYCYTLLHFVITVIVLSLSDYFLLLKILYPSAAD